MWMRVPAAALAAAISCAACMSTISPADGTPSPPLTKLQLACRLPVSTAQDGEGGFINFPATTFTRDASSLESYDSALARWVPVPRSSISPDGRRYAFVDNRPDPFVNVVDVATGGMSTTEIISVWNVATPARLNVNPMSVLAFERQGIYLEKVSATGGAPHGLALLDPDTLTYRDPAPGATDSQTYVAVRDGAPLAASADEIAGSSSVLGFDGAGRLLMAATSAAGYRIFAGSTAIFTGPPGDPDNPTGPAVADSHGLWFGSPSGVVWHYADGGTSLDRVAVAPFRPATVAGPCL